MKMALALGCLFVAACSGGNTSTDKTLTPSAPAAAPASPAAPAEETIVPAGTAASVTGAFLAGCSSDTTLTFVDGGDAAEVTACIVLGADGQRAAVEGARIRVLIDGTWVEPPVVAAKRTDAPWHVGVHLKPTDVARAESFEVSFTDSGKASAVATTDNDEFDWRSSPVFKDLLEGVKVLTVLISRTELDKSGRIKARLDQALPLHIAMMTHQVVKGNVGVDAADAICAAEGEAAKIPRGPSGVWRAMLSTSAEPAKEHLRISANEVMNIEGQYIGNQSYWDETQHTGSIHYDSLGYSSSNTLDLGNGSIDWVFFAWTGTKLGGVLDDVNGNCKDWTSDSPLDFARIANPGRLELFADELVWPCSRPARLICMLSHEPL